MSTELGIYVDTFTTGILAFKNIALLLLLFQGKKSEDFNNGYSSFLRMTLAFDAALNGLQSMEQGVSKIPTKDTGLKQVKRSTLANIDMLITEFKDAKTLSKELLKSIDETVKKLDKTS